MLSSSSGSRPLRSRPGLSASAVGEVGAGSASTVGADWAQGSSLEGAVSTPQSLVAGWAPHPFSFAAHSLAPSAAASLVAASSTLSSVLPSSPPQDWWTFLSESLCTGKTSSERTKSSRKMTHVLPVPLCLSNWRPRPPPRDPPRPLPLPRPRPSLSSGLGVC